MRLTNLLFGEDKSRELFPKCDFENRYVINVKNEFAMGKENPLMKSETESTIFLKQITEPTKILNSILIQSISGSTDNEALNPYLQQMLLLANISKEIVLERDARGKLKSVVNVDMLKDDWMTWKKTDLHKVFETTNEQHKFVNNYEKGLDSMLNGIKNSFQYIALLPEIYHFRPYISDLHRNKTSAMILPSKLVEDMIIRYHLELVKMEASPEINLILRSHLLEEDKMMHQYLIPIYSKLSDYKLSDYVFQVDAAYAFYPSTQKIKCANFLVLEKMHDHLYYKIEILIQEANEM